MMSHHHLPSADRLGLAHPRGPRLRFSPPRHPASLGRPVAGLTLAGLVIASGAVVAAGAAAPAADPAVAAGALPLPVALAAGPAAVVQRRAAGLAQALGLRGTATAARQVTDPLLGRVVDEVELTDGGRRTGLLVHDARTGRPLAIADLAWTAADDAPRTSRASAPGLAANLVRAAGLSVPTTPPTVVWDEAADAWQVTWRRVVDGVPVLSDDLTVRLRPAGRLASLSAPDSPLAPEPARRISAPAALKAAREFAAQQGLDAQPGFRLDDEGLAWSEANGFAGGAVAVEPTLYLCRVVRISYLAAGASVPSLIELHIDAGSGAIIGGDQTS